jgi:hypothetical protein
MLHVSATKCRPNLGRNEMNQKKEFKFNIRESLQVRSENANADVSVFERERAQR